MSQPLIADAPPEEAAADEFAAEAVISENGETFAVPEDGVEEEVYHDPVVHLPALSDAPMDLPTLHEHKHNKEKAAAVTAAVLVHVALAALLGVLIVVVPGPPSSEITAIAAPTTQEQAPTTNKIAEPPPAQATPQLTSSMKFVTASNASAVPMPAVEFDPTATTLDLGTTMGNFDANFGSTGSGSVMMFGKQINARKIAVVMDVSRSMTRYLPVVVQELKRVGKDSPLILYFGCWLSQPPKNEEKVLPVGGDDFGKFWQHWQGKKDFQTLGQEYHQLKYDPKAPMPLEDVYKQVYKRKETYYIDRFLDPKDRATSVYSALMAKEIRDADTIYWFADFQDKIDDETAREVVKKFKSRGRKIYIHAPHATGQNLANAKEKIVEPLGGEAIILDVK